MDTIENRSIVVGIDGSPESDAALEWAIEEATRQALPLHCFGARDQSLEDTTATLGGVSGGDVADPIAEEVTAAVDTARRRSPGLTVGSEVSNGFPAATLVALSEHAEVIVLGNRGRSALVKALLGSVATQVSTHARCPVVIVRAPEASGPVGAGTPMTGVVVGVDAGTVSEPALEYAFVQASRQGCRLDVVHVWWSTVPLGLTEDVRVDQETHEDVALAEALAGWSQRYPDVVVHRHIPVGPTVQTLVEVSTAARLLVVGSRGRGGFRRLLLGSVGQGVLQHARCPVAVVPTGVTDPFAAR